MRTPKTLLAIFTAFLLVIITVQRGFARIPEPPFIVYGLAREDATTITLEVDGEEMTSYTMGDNSNAGDYYILRVPIDTVDPQAPGTAREGDSAEIYINGEATPAATLTIGEKGGTRVLHLATGDADGDGMLDLWEQQIIDADPDDGFETINDVLPGDDFDGDGVQNMDDKCPVTPAAADVDADGCSIFQSVAMGDANGDGNVDLMDAIIILRILTGIDPHEACNNDADVNNDGKLGLSEIIYIMEKVVATE